MSLEHTNDVRHWLKPVTITYHFPGSLKLFDNMGQSHCGIVFVGDFGKRRFHPVYSLVKVIQHDSVTAQFRALLCRQDDAGMSARNYAPSNLGNVTTCWDFSKNPESLSLSLEFYQHLGLSSHAQTVWLKLRP